MAGPKIRRADFLMVLAYATDLATGQSRDFALRACVAAMRIAEAAGLGAEARREVYHQALLRYIGCNADTHLLAAAFGDEIALRQDLAKINLGSLADLAETFTRAFTRLFKDLPADEMAAAIERGLADALPTSVPILAGHCEVAKRIGQRIGLSADACANLSQLYERWDGHGLPHHLKGEAVALPVRLVTLAQDAVVLDESLGRAGMLKTIRERRDGAYEAALADIFLADADRILTGTAGPVAREVILALEPAPHAVLDESACEEAYLAIADMIDMRMPFTAGHSRAVAALADKAAKEAGLPEGERRHLRWAAYMHDLGELSVPVSTWQKAGLLTPRETDAVHLHPYYGERALAALGEEGAEVRAMVLRHHERLDGTGYHRSARAPDLSPAARILAAAEAFQTALEERPHRQAVTRKAAAERLREGVRSGTLCADAVDAVLSAAGQSTRRQPGARPSGVTPRESEVLRLIAAGLTAKEVARKLTISPKTADNHIQSLYSKIGVTTRAGAALYALEHGLAARH